MSSRAPEPALWSLLLSYALALVINALPLAGNLQLLLPPMGFLVLAWWAINDLNHTHFVAAVIIGLLYDTLTGTLLGLHAMIFSVLLFLLLRLRLRLRVVRPLQQGFTLTLLLFGHQLLLLPFVSTDAATNAYFWSMPLTGFVLWPFLRLLLNWLNHVPAPRS
ncbi:rod shape-determining protein MreD [Sulfurivirga sp.]|uniref:rod shape-determining protein MreD n=1 Tax=Sulfurivirga sp. TaxID=2614236 RepID=UPI0025F546EA|nr:rod shape-determining protein MreD [Sulfurivirga sp.]